MENKSADAVLGSSSAPFENALARKCGLAKGYQGVSHPSLPNYLAATGGSTFGVTDDDSPSAHPIAGQSLFGQLDAAGLSWRSYQESMTTPCQLDSSGKYAVKHNPAAYFTDLRKSCAANDVGFSGFRKTISAGRLPAFSFVTPNLCNDTHDCPVSTGDAWLSTWITRLIDGPNYRSGNTVIVLTWDEAEGGGSTVPTMVIAPSVRPRTVVTRTFNHYSLLRTTEDLLGLSALRKASSATSMAPGFHL